jgi:DNA-binding transcriptional LysR family regulator
MYHGGVLEARVKLSQLRVLLAVLEQQSLTNAASELNTSQSAVSHALKELEGVLGAPLVERGRFGARATALGAKVAVHARTMLRAEQAMLEEVRQTDEDLQGLVRVASFRSIATHFLPDAITIFQAQYPNIRFEIQTLEGINQGIERALLEGRTDLGILTLPTLNALQAVEFARDEWVAVFPDARAPKTEVASWKDIQALPFLLCNEAGATTIRAHFATAQVPLEPAAQVEDDGVLLSMIAHGFGVSILARLAIEPIPVGVTIRALPKPLERRFAVASTKTRLESPSNRAFYEFLQSEALKSCTVIANQTLQLV